MQIATILLLEINYLINFYFYLPEGCFKENSWSRKGSKSQEVWAIARMTFNSIW